MPRLPLLTLILAAGVLSACQATSPGGGAGEAVTPNAVAGGPIETTALDAPPAQAEADAAAPAVAAEGTATAAAQGSSPDDPAGTPTEPAATEPAPTEPAAVDPEPAPKAELEPVPKAPKSERQLACERKKGRWEKVGLGELRACVFPTRDGGQSCRKESDCEGVCLARSGTCAPFQPLFGCNEVLQENGARGTLCIQ